VEGHFLPSAVTALASSPATLAVLAGPIHSQEPRPLAARSLTAGSARGLGAPMMSIRRWA
jgi:hypothetical protein